MSVFQSRYRGFRLIDIVAFGCLLAMVFGVYLAKTMAGRERAEIARIERQMAEERDRIRLLKAEVAHLEQPERVERLSESYLGLAPVDAKREAPLENLPEIARPADEANARAEAGR
jgi:cell division protein FtsL